MKLIVSSLALFATTFGLQVWMDLANIGELADPVLGDVRSYWARVIHEDVLGPANQVAAAVFLFSLLDRVWLPWLSIRDAALRQGQFADVSQNVRAAIVLGYFLAWSAVMLAFRT